MVAGADEAWAPSRAAAEFIAEVGTLALPGSGEVGLEGCATWRRLTRDKEPIPTQLSEERSACGMALFIDPLLVRIGNGVK